MNDVISVLIVAMNFFHAMTREYFKSLGGEFPKIPESRVKTRKQGHLKIGGTFICHNVIGYKRVVI